jgi:hypothetical protein
MRRSYRASMAVLIASLIAIESTTLFASDPERAASAAQSPLTFHGQPLTAISLHRDDLAITGATVPSASEPNAYTQFGGFRRGRRRNAGAATAIFLGAAGAIAGTAVLVYANRPECNANPTLGGCGYGTKVAGGAVLSAGLVGIMIGALTWR